ncbi:MAG TPA: hypothetical protein VNS60_02375 [Solirubrobacterales bacterium]|nr:hypothetical protein [Solirubrobacterales bacterium]
MRIGYSFWGFLGEGIVDTPDGGRSHRPTLVAALAERGHELVFLQPNRDLLEAGTPVRVDLRAAWTGGFPELDLLWLEWRWPIPGRNTPADRQRKGFTPDLERQSALIEHYTLGLGVPTLIWDKDLQLAPGDPVRDLPHVVVCEAALHPRGDARRLLFPVSDKTLGAAQHEPPASFGHGELDLVYIGNRYRRDSAFERYLAPAAAQLHHHRVFGKWAGTERWPQVQFAGRLGFGEVAATYRSALATVLLLPDRYAAAGQMTQRIFEACLAGCYPLLPAEIRGGSVFVPDELHVQSAADVVAGCKRLRTLSPEALADLASRCLARLDVFRVSRQLASLDDLLHAEAPAR